MKRGKHPKGYRDISLAWSPSRNAMPVPHQEGFHIKHVMKLVFALEITLNFSLHPEKIIEYIPFQQTSFIHTFLCEKKKITSMYVHVYMYI